MDRLFWPRALLLVVLLFPGLCGTRHVSQGGTEGPRAPKDEALTPGTNDSQRLHHPGKRYLVPLTPPLADYGTGFKVVNCRKSEGHCQEYCNYMEIQVGYCSERKDACCLPQN
ncbi:sperm-associated antigen 11B-like [Myotis daubentonii]|uniref:sperm-associated antigen 11B-like n=1 Tax=Myotis daubentonii TaxID=98922 RepID=UPI0028731362|nr:sperm-associated antigen 11B-like [Myotis daubentonii]